MFVPHLNRGGKKNNILIKKAYLPPHVPERHNKMLFYLIIVLIKAFLIVYW